MGILVVSAHCAQAALRKAAKSACDLDTEKFALFAQKLVADAQKIDQYIDIAGLEAAGQDIDIKLADIKDQIDGLDQDDEAQDDIAQLIAIAGLAENDCPL